jgi:hypothetical protein
MKIQLPTKRNLNMIFSRQRDHTETNTSAVEKKHAIDVSRIKRSDAFNVFVELKLEVEICISLIAVLWTHFERFTEFCVWKMVFLEFRLSFCS